MGVEVYWVLGLVWNVHFYYFYLIEENVFWSTDDISDYLFLIREYFSVLRIIELGTYRINESVWCWDLLGEESNGDFSFISRGVGLKKLDSLVVFLFQEFLTILAK